MSNFSIFQFPEAGSARGRGTPADREPKPGGGKSRVDKNATKRTERTNT